MLCPANGVTYTVKDDPKAANDVDGFLCEGLKVRANKRLIGSSASVFNAVNSMIQSYTTLGIVPDDAYVNAGSTFGGILHSAKGTPAACTRMVAPKA